MDSRIDLNYDSIQIALDRAAYLEKWGGPYNNADMVNVQVLAAEVQRLRAKLNVIAFPRRGSPEAGWGVEEIGRFAADGLDGGGSLPPLEKLDQGERALRESEFDRIAEKLMSIFSAPNQVDTDSPVPQVAPAAQREAFVAGSARMAFKMTTPMHASELIDEAQAVAVRRYPDTAGEESHPNGDPTFASLLNHTKDFPAESVVTLAVHEVGGYQLTTTLGNLRLALGMRGESK